MTKVFPHKVTSSEYWQTLKFWCPVRQDFIDWRHYDFCPECDKRVKR